MSAASSVFGKENYYLFDILSSSRHYCKQNYPPITCFVLNRHFCVVGYDNDKTKHLSDYICPLKLKEKPDYTRVKTLVVIPLDVLSLDRRTHISNELDYTNKVESIKFIGKNCFIVNDSDIFTVTINNRTLDVIKSKNRDVDLSSTTKATKKAENPISPNSYYRVANGQVFIRNCSEKVFFAPKQSDDEASTLDDKSAKQSGPSRLVQSLRSNLIGKRAATDLSFLYEESFGVSLSATQGTDVELSSLHASEARAAFQEKTVENQRILSILVTLKNEIDFKASDTDIVVYGDFLIVGAKIDDVLTFRIFDLNSKMQIDKIPYAYLDKYRNSKVFLKDLKDLEFTFFDEKQNWAIVQDKKFGCSIFDFITQKTRYLSFINQMTCAVFYKNFLILGFKNDSDAKGYIKILDRLSFDEVQTIPDDYFYGYPREILVSNNRIVCFDGIAVKSFDFKFTEEEQVRETRMTIEK